MSDNNWETQPRSEDGRFSYRGDVEEELAALEGKEKRPSPRLVRAYDLGVRNRHISLWDLPDEDIGLQEDDETRLFYSAGRQGVPLPKWVIAERYGDIPVGGKSKNYADNNMEKGLSVSKLVSEDDKYEWFRSFGGRDRKKVLVAGWLHFERGSDGEPLLVAPIYIKR